MTQVLKCLAILAMASLVGCQKPQDRAATAKKEPVAAAAPASAPPLRVAFVYVSPVADAGWTAQHNTGRLELEKTLAGKVTTSFVEKVPEGADAERVIRDLAQQGNKLMFTTSYGFMNPTLKVAEEFPNTVFEHATGYKSAKNVGTYNVRFYEGRYLAGIVAGRVTKTDTLGYVAAFPIPEVLQGINAFTLGARSVNPKVQVRVVWVNTWYDPGKERDAAVALIGQKADVLTHHTDSTATVAAAEEKGVRAVAYHSDMAKFGPKAQVAAVTHHWGAYYTRVAQSVIDGKWTPSNLWGGMKDGMIKLEALHADVPADVKAEVERGGADIAAGKLHPFTGPIRSNTAKDVVAKGETLSDEQLAKMDYYVEGVVGKVPTGN